MNFLKKISSFLRSKIGGWLLILTAILFGIWLFRACTSSRLNETKMYHIAKTGNWAPIQLSGKEANLQAFINELISTIAEEEKLPIDLDTLRPEDLFKVLDNGEYDGILIALSLDSFTKEHHAISNSIFQAGPVLIVPFASEVTSINDLNGKAIGISKDSFLSFRLSSQHPDLLLVSYDKILSALNDLETQSIAGVVMEAQLAYTYTQALFPGKLKVATPQLFDWGIRLITNKNPRGELLIEKFDSGLAKLKSSGDYDKLLERWELVSPQ